MPWIVCTSGPDRGKQIEVTDHVITIGRAPDNILRLIEERASRYHCHVAVLNGELVLQDLNSTNGIQIKGEKLRGQKVTLHLGSRFAIGGDAFEFQRGADHRFDVQENLHVDGNPWEQGREQTKFETQSDFQLSPRKDILSFLMPWRKS